MKINCRICHNSGISILNAIAYSAEGKMRCESCGKTLGLTRFGSIVYKILEGCFILFSIFYSFYLLSAWPLIVSIPLTIMVRAFLLPQFAQKVKNKYPWRISK